LSLTFLVFGPCYCFLQATSQLQVLQFQRTQLLCMAICNTIITSTSEHGALTPQ
jgi:hypothetical protein